ncbi:MULTISPECIES: undecaprenyldiphospho-muramoylpentapeptide beta-N-acetylglucosaminyltransferase [unclassified Nocardiopsis]|uniref:undecaprenyldiphospho-muramoylpentapeptide beta-N-acetylglucosaminyltransferase n=1 Tax=unclassified Nocardiopsis TaxID=2649073 RepID=UPI00048E8169|nr:undecaprenyldiphospho-muramoylpentapeptide beta-N-acetylglucosaminyltransferase [Nocardiopsis sp. CNT312]
MRVALAGGGTAGHIEPALSLADALLRVDPDTEILCLGTERGLETRLIPMRGYELGLIPAVPLPRRLTPGLLTVPGKLAGALSAAGEQLDRIQADVLVGFGGYVATPGYLAAKRRKIPIVVHEANPLPGLANRLGARLTPHVYTGHPHAELKGGRFIGIPLRRQITALDRLAMGDKARAYFGLRHDLPTLLIFGGSQGAQRINETAFAAAAHFRDAGVQVLHVVGPKNADEPQDLTQDGVPYVAVPYVDRMDMAYAAADVAMCRSGALTCAELTAVGLPGAFVPLAIGNGEQALNAEPIVQAGGGVMVGNADVSVEWIATQLIPLLTDTDRVVNMSEAAARMGRRDADTALAREVLAIARGDKPTPDMPISDDDADEAYTDDGKDAR